MLRFPISLLAGLALAVAPQIQADVNPETGVPVFQHFSPDLDTTSPENWAIAQDPRGVLYFANTSGLLEFDGLNWQLHKLKGNSVVKSVAVDRKGTVYVGGQGDFGYLRPNQKGGADFVSLLDKVAQADRSFLDVWRILPTPEGVYFSAYSRLFRLNNDGSVRTWKPVGHFGRAIYVAGALYVKTSEQGLMRMDRDRLTPAPGGALFTKLGVTAAVNFEGGALLGTPGGMFRLNETGVTPFRTDCDPWFASNLLYTLHMLPNGDIAAGTRNGGIVILNHSGVTQRVISKQDGLPDNFVEAMFTDSQGGVWIAGHDGLTRFNPGLSEYGVRDGIEGLVESMARQDGVLYAGTKTGLGRMITLPGQPPQFEQVAGIGTTVWALLPHAGGLIAATDTGLFQVHGEEAVPISGTEKRLLEDVSQSRRDSGLIYAAGPFGLIALRQDGKTWRKEAEFTTPGQEFRSVVEDADGRVWAATQDAVWRVDFRQQPAAAERFGSADGVPSGWLNVRSLRGHVVLATGKGLKIYSAATKRFEKDDELGTEFSDGKKDVYNVFEGPGGVWITGQTYHGLLSRENGRDVWHPEPLVGAGIKEIYWMLIDPDGTVWATGAKRTLNRWDRSLYGDPNRNFNVLARNVRDTSGNSDLYSGTGAFGGVTLSHRQNSLRFEFAAPFYEDPYAVEYQYRLEGNDRDWSPWSHDTRKDYTNLREHAYSFHARARTPHGVQSMDTTLSFDVLPPWYRTWWAYGLYLLLAALAVRGIVRVRTRQLEQEKHRLETIVEERTVEIRQQRDQIQIEERKSQSLLLNILPATVADELKSTGAVKPVGFDDVTVCFTDFVGFTLSSEQMQPGRLVDALNEYFTRFDEIIARYGLEKLKTIGDSYMFVSGLPTSRSSHAVDAVLAAMEMVAVVKELAVKQDGTGWDIRVGLHSGPVIAGVVGTRKFAFDIWGNTVNFAARMESSGVRGAVNMSERTCRLTRGLIDCESRGHIRIKEGRELPMFLAQNVVANFAARYQEEFGDAPKSVPASEALQGKAASAALTVL